MSETEAGGISPDDSSVVGPRTIAKEFKAHETIEGAGVTVFRSLGFDESARLDPFLLLDEMVIPQNRTCSGFPNHPHRGFCTLTLMLSGGEIEHRDSAGNTSVVGPGGAQWISAGRGIFHSEHPRSTDGDAQGLQLWINLPAKDKMTKPRYQDVAAEQIPVVSASGVKIRVVAGVVDSEVGPLKRHPGMPGLLLDVNIEAGVTWSYPVSSLWNVFVYLYGGGGKVGSKSAVPRYAYVLSNDGDQVTITAGKKGLKCIVAASEPLNEPIVQRKSCVPNHCMSLT